MRALLYYLIPYGAISIGAFAVVVARERELGEPVTLDNLAGFGWERPLLGFSMATFMLGFAGFPLTGGFMGKFLIFSSASEAGWNWLVIVGVLATLVSLYYYLAVIRAMYMRPAAELGLAPIGGSPPREIMLSSAAFLAMVVNVGSFFAVQPLVDFARSAADDATALGPDRLGPPSSTPSPSSAWSANAARQAESANAVDPPQRRQRAGATPRRRAARWSDSAGSNRLVEQLSEHRRAVAATIGTAASRR